MSLDPESVLANIDGWHGASISELSGGLTNKVWKVVSGDRVGVLKIDAQLRSEPFNSRPEEAVIQKHAAQAGLAPGVIYADDRVYFSEYVEGTVWSRELFDDPANLVVLAGALRKLHSLPLSGRAFDARIAAKRYVEKISGLDADVIALCRGVVDSMRLPHNLCCCHNDLVAENLISTPALMFLDWEYACDNDPFFDLATIVEHHELSEIRIGQLLDAYLDGDSQRWRAHLEKMRKLYLALLCLWLASRPSPDHDELQRVSERVITSCS